MRTLYLDTASTGPWLRQNPANSPDQPHLARVALILTDGDEVVERICHLLALAPDASFDEAHGDRCGITLDDLRSWGRPLIVVENCLHRIFKQAEEVVAFNFLFHRRSLMREFPSLKWPTRTRCAMHQASVALGYKATMSEAHHRFTNTRIPMWGDATSAGSILVEALRQVDRGARFAAMPTTTPAA